MCKVTFKTRRGTISLFKFASPSRGFCRFCSFPFSLTRFGTLVCTEQASSLACLCTTGRHPSKKCKIILLTCTWDFFFCWAAVWFVSAALSCMFSARLRVRSMMFASNYWWKKTKHFFFIVLLSVFGSPSPFNLTNPASLTQPTKRRFPLCPGIWLPAIQVMFGLITY